MIKELFYNVRHRFKVWDNLTLFITLLLFVGYEYSNLKNTFYFLFLYLAVILIVGDSKNETIKEIKRAIYKYLDFSSIVVIGIIIMRALVFAIITGRILAFFILMLGIAIFLYVGFKIEKSMNET